MNILAADLGATSGRLMLGQIKEGRIALTELIRFTNEMVERNGRRTWDIAPILNNIMQGARNCPAQPDSFAVDSWGVDYGYLDAEGRPFDEVISYRDTRTNPVMEQVLSEVPDLYMRTGIQCMPFNTVFQVISDIEIRPDVVKRASRLLMLPELISYMLTGVALNEYTIGSTTALLDMRTGLWDKEIMERYGFPPELLGEVNMPGRVLGNLRDSSAKDAGWQFPVILSTGHDTGGAIAGIPVMPGRKWGYISSGTWSLVGVELKSPIINDASFHHQITNEGGVEGTIRFLKNAHGMWLLEECLREWKAKGMVLDYAGILEAARQSKPFMALIDPTDWCFQAPESMIGAIGDFCRRTAQPVPETPGQIARCIFESLALLYREVFDTIEGITGQAVEEIHIVGGGSRNELLNQMTCNACGKTVVKGPVEATVLGNIAVQAIALGLYKNLADYREQQSLASTPVVYQPQDEKIWHNALERLKALRRDKAQQ